jgi:radical SAM/Cys-rich protein
MALATTSLQKRGAALADADEQLRVLRGGNATSFAEALRPHGLMPLRPRTLTTLQVNVGKMCNQACKHCHVDAGPDRQEIMTRETMQMCLDAVDRLGTQIVDLTGGAPEMNPDFRWFVEELTRRDVKVIVRCNLTIIVANPKYNDLPQFFATHRVHVVSSLPFYDASHTDRQRGGGVFEDSITALRMLNDAGYGKDGTGLVIDLVYNPLGALLPGPQASLEKEFKRQLLTNHNVVFNALHCITNMPISRFLEFLVNSGNYERYMNTLITSFNPAAAENVMCRDMISVGWDGQVYDCDFNQMLDLTVASPLRHIADVSAEALMGRAIVIDRHCFGCTAGSGSSCGGQTA